MNTLFLPLFLLLVFILIRFLWKKNKWITPSSPFEPKWRIILQQKISFYNALSPEEKTLFEFKIQEFLLNCRITGIEVNVDIVDELLVASSAVIPIFKFPEWRYTNFYEVLLYPRMFNDKFETSGPDRSILGMVGTGYMDGKMILSKPALHLGFSNESDKKNTAIHEFVHIIDKADGTIDGIPELLMEKQYAIPWLQLIQKKIEDIYMMRSDINPYGATNRTEFFAVASEYFFQRPKLLAKKHPKLYRSMEKIFNHKMSARNLKRAKFEIGRNNPCPCNSGDKFKKCCGRKHYK
ncbi:MAG: Mlc titration factor MtfA (ptsG expression regulator) [Saprospiraceae bacterium]|jgi:Mlc titration factor MtfA (ptsG expression regulator)